MGGRFIRILFPVVMLPFAPGCGHSPGQRLESLDKIKPEFEALLAEEGLARLLDSVSQPDAPKSEEARAVRRRVETMLNGKLSEASQRLLGNHALALHASAAWRRGALPQVRTEALKLLERSDASPTDFKLGIALATLTLETAEAGPTDFAAFRASLCRSVCQSRAWALLNDLDPGWAETPTGFRQRIFDSGVAKALLGTQALPEWLRVALTPPKQLPADLPPPRVPEPVLPPGQKRLVEMQRAFGAGRLSEAAALAKSVPVPALNEGCVPEAAYAAYVLGLAARGRQDRVQFLAQQESLVRQLDERTLPCSAESMRMAPEKWDVFRTDAVLWLARLQWENGDLRTAAASAGQALTLATQAGLSDLAFEAVQVQVGRIGYEALPPADNLVLLEQGRNVVGLETDDVRSWFGMRMGLFQFTAQAHPRAQAEFETVARSTRDASSRAGALYWAGRSAKARGDAQAAARRFTESGQADPLSYFDILAGAELESPSGHASSARRSPFKSGWKRERETWVSLHEDKPFRLFRNITALFSSPAQTTALEGPPDAAGTFRSTLQQSVLLASVLRALVPENDFDDFNALLRDSRALAAELLRADVQWLRQSYGPLQQKGRLAESQRSGEQVAWLLHAVGDYLNAILFVGQLRERGEFTEQLNPHLFFMFYPRAYAYEIGSAARRCGIDEDLIFAVARQESLFQPAVKSGAGAVGLVQLLPATAKRILKGRGFPGADAPDLSDPRVNALAGACYLADLLKRYDGNRTLAVAAYNAGEGQVDRWRKERRKLDDDPFFVEFIPFGETKKYVQRVLRNYHNIKWIYGSD